MSTAAAGGPPAHDHAAIVVAIQRQLSVLKLTLTQYGVGDPELFRVLERFCNATLRGAAAGLVLRGGLHLASQTIGLLRRTRKGKRSVSWADSLLDTLRYIAFLGSLSGVYVAVDEGIAALFGKKRSASWRALVAGACAGPSLLWTGSESRHYSMATYIFIRGLTLLVRCGNKRTSHPVVHRLLTPTRAAHGDTALMCLSGCQILYSFIMMPHTLPQAYVRFITKHADKDPLIWAAVRELALRNSSGLPSGPLELLKGTSFASHSHPVPCAFLHPGQSCHGHVLTSVPRGWLRALQVYVPVYVLPAILVHRGRLLQQPQQLWPKIAAGAARSSLFLALYIGLAFTGACTVHRVSGTSTAPLLASSLVVCGLATLVEKKSRRMELALYCAARALEAFGQCLVDWGLLSAHKLPVRMDVALFSAAVACIMHCYSGDGGQHRDVFRSKYLNWFDFVFGNKGLQEGSICHIPSNLDLITQLEQRARRTFLPRPASLPLLRTPSDPPTPTSEPNPHTPTQLPSSPHPKSHAKDATGPGTPLHMQPLTGVSSTPPPTTHIPLTHHHTAAITPHATTQHASRYHLAAAVSAAAHTAHTPHTAHTRHASEPMLPLPPQLTADPTLHPTAPPHTHQPSRLAPSSLTAPVSSAPAPPTHNLTPLPPAHIHQTPSPVSPPSPGHLSEITSPPSTTNTPKSHHSPPPSAARSPLSPVSHLHPTSLPTHPPTHSNPTTEQPAQQAPPLSTPQPPPPAPRPQTPEASTPAPPQAHPHPLTSPTTPLSTPDLPATASTPASVTPEPATPNLLPSTPQSTVPARTSGTSDVDPDTTTRTHSDVAPIAEPVEPLPHFPAPSSAAAVAHLLSPHTTSNAQTAHAAPTPQPGSPSVNTPAPAPQAAHTPPNPTHSPPPSGSSSRSKPKSQRKRK